MTELSTEEPDLSATQGIRARSVGFWTDLGSVSRRAVRQLPRDPEMVFPAVFIPVFFFAINVGSLQDLAESSAPPGFDFKAFQLPVAIIFAVTGISAAAWSPTSSPGTSTVCWLRRSTGWRCCSG